MKIMKKATAVLLVLTFMFCILSSCGNPTSETDKIIGTWKTDDYSFEFRDGGKGSWIFSDQSLEFTWKTDGNRLIIELPLGENTDITTGTYSIDGDTLSYTVSGETTVFTRSK